MEDARAVPPRGSRRSSHASRRGQRSRRLAHFHPEGQCLRVDRGRRRGAREVREDRGRRHRRARGGLRSGECDSGVVAWTRPMNTERNLAKVFAMALRAAMMEIGADAIIICNVAQVPLSDYRTGLASLESIAEELEKFAASPAGASRG